MIHLTQQPLLLSLKIGVVSRKGFREYRNNAPDIRHDNEYKISHSLCKHSLLYFHSGRRMIYRNLITLCLLMALTLSSFGHSTLSPDAEAQAEAYILAGGSWSDLCSNQGDPLAAGAKCIACIIGQSCLLSNPTGTARDWPTEIQLGRQIVNVFVDHTSMRSSHPARGPPFDVI